MICTVRNWPTPGRLAYPIRRLVRRPPPGIARRGERRTILLVSGPSGEARRYRCDHRREQLLACGIDADICYRAAVRLAALASRYSCIVLYRVPWDDDVERLLERAATEDCTVVCDFDDLVFDTEVAQWIRALEALPTAERSAYVEGIALQRRTLMACGAATVATDPLASAAISMEVRTAVLHNVVSSEMVRAADAARAARTRSDGHLRIGYLSGTPTHDRDFLEAADAILFVLGAYSHVRFVAAGFLRLDERFETHESRIERVPYRPWHALPSLIATLDVNMAPLEHGNPFTDAKSCIKFLEAGLLAVPTIASGTADFRRVIDDRANGLIADSPDAWRAGLVELVESVDLRRILGERAREEILDLHTTRVTASTAADVLERMAPGLTARA